MNPMNVMNKIFHQTLGEISQSNSFTLKENQVVQGKVIKLFPDHKALIQIGQSKLIGQMETSLTASESYWFKVGSSMKNGIQLKMLKKIDENGIRHQGMSRDLLQLFNEKPTKVNLLFAKQLLLDNIPITKQLFQMGVEILHQTNSKEIQETISAMSFALKQQYPLSREIVQSIIQLNTNPSLLSQLDSLVEAIQHEKIDTPIVKQLEEKIVNIKQIADDQKLERLTTIIQSSNQLNVTKEELHLIQGVIQKADSKEMLGRLVNEMKPLLTQFQNVTSAESHSDKLLTDKEKNLLIKLVNDQSVFTSKKEVLNHLFTAQDQLGTKSSYQDLLQNVGEGKQQLNLRGLLLAASKELDSSPFKEKVDQLIQRFNGLTLFHQDHGPTQQFITQIPLYFPQNSYDLTLQWSGKKQKDGKIDPNFCRVLFFLELPTLSDMMIDVQIQNRVMTISILNNHKLMKEISSLTSEELKKVLGKMNYQLSSLSVKPFDVSQNSHPKENFKAYSKIEAYSGVDLRI